MFNKKVRVLVNYSNLLKYDGWYSYYKIISKF